MRCGILDESGLASVPRQAFGVPVDCSMLSVQPWKAPFLLSAAKFPCMKQIALGASRTSIREALRIESGQRRM